MVSYMRGQIIFLLYLATADYINADIVKPQLIEEPELLEGDIVLDPKLKRVIQSVSSTSGRSRRDTVIYHQNKWRHAVIPYKFRPNVGLRTRLFVSRAMKEIHKDTCIWFVPHTDEADFIEIAADKGCYSSIGRQGGKQTVSIGPGCEYEATIVHELMHSIGFFHEQSRYDRDHYIKVLWWNIQQGAERNFLTYTHGQMDTLGLPYDFDSLMHYGNKEFSKNFGDTLQALEDAQRRLGNNILSKQDVKQMLKLYKCHKPAFQTRTKRCYDVHQRACDIFRAYPEYCDDHKYFTIRFCRRTCRYCNPYTNHSEGR